jgi:hypothetical protein
MPDTNPTQPVPATQVARQAERLAPHRDHAVPPGHGAEDMFYRLVSYIREFEANLDHDHEIGARMVSFGASVQFHIVDIGYWNPDIITFEGLDEAGHRMKLIQNVSQLNVLLISMPKREEHEEARRIGFVLESKQAAAAPAPAAPIAGGAV